MPIKSILLHLANDPGHRSRLAVALDLARRHGATIRALFAEPTGDMPDAVAGRGSSYAFVSESREAARRTADTLSKELARICGRDGISCEWLDEPGDPAALLARFALMADLVIVGRGPADNGLEPDLCEALPGELACPLLAVPENWAGDPVGRRVLVAWKSGLPTARALHGALPLLCAAESAAVLTVGGEAEALDPVLRYLALHGVHAEPRREANDREAGEVILRLAGELGADLLVMGSYGHARAREMILGGATRHVVTHMRLPVLFAR
jgi:nucleotide-binding universal stress UspA family protein